VKVKIKPADTWFSKCVRHAANWTCAKCGKQYTEENARGLDCSHTFSRRFKATRWASENCVPLCMGCHLWYHQQPTESGMWMRELMGEKAYDLLKEKKEQIVKVTKAEEKEIAAHYRKEYRRMLEDGTTEFESYL
jgi:hypothetical protein